MVPVVATLLDQVVSYAGDPTDEPGLVFTFAVGDKQRTHRWDTRHGKAEVSWTNADGKACTAVVPVPYTGADPVLTEAWGMFVNDQYWLLAPAKLKDPGVHVEVHDADLHVSFDHVGLTPGDQYTFHADPGTGAITGWDFVLQGGKAASWTWSAPVAVGGLHLSLERTNGDARIHFEDVRSERVKLGKVGGSCG